MHRLAHRALALLVVATLASACADVDLDDEAVGTDEAEAKAKKKKKKEDGEKGSRAADDGKTRNDDAAFDLKIVNLNVENVPSPAWASCRGSGEDFVRFLGLEGNAPDVFTVQQLTGSDQAAWYAERLKAETGAAYGFVVGEDRPTSFVSGCPGTKDLQTNAIFFRKSRLELVPESVRRFQPRTSATADCAAGSESRLSRTLAVGARLRDKRNSDRAVAVVSFHLPKEDVGCVATNVGAALDQLEALGGNLRVLAGDANARDRVDGVAAAWFGLAGLRGYVDPVFRACDGKASCLREHWTCETREDATPRIDFVFLRRGNGAKVETADVGTVGYGEVRRAKGTHASLPYSDHRAVRVRVR